LLFEARVAGGRLLTCSMDLTSDLQDRPVARQMRHSLLAYMQGDQFRPAVEVDVAAVRALSRTPSRLEQLGAVARADSQQHGYEASQAMDGDPETMWHTAWEGGVRPYPHHLIIDLQQTVDVAGLAYLPRQDMTNGRIGQYAIYVSQDGQDWGRPIVEGTWPNTNERQEARFPGVRAARFLKLEARAEVLGRDWASAAEVEVLE
jgi:hypothetical protein